MRDDSDNEHKGFGQTFFKALKDRGVAEAFGFHAKKRTTDAAPVFENTGTPDADSLAELKEATKDWGNPDAVQSSEEMIAAMSAALHIGDEPENETILAMDEVTITPETPASKSEGFFQAMVDQEQAKREQTPEYQERMALNEARSTFSDLMNSPLQFESDADVLNAVESIRDNLKASGNTAAALDERNNSSPEEMRRQISNASSTIHVLNTDDIARKQYEDRAELPTHLYTEKHGHLNTDGSFENGTVATHLDTAVSQAQASTSIQNTINEIAALDAPEAPTPAAPAPGGMGS